MTNFYVTYAITNTWAFELKTAIVEIIWSNYTNTDDDAARRIIANLEALENDSIDLYRWEKM